MAEPKLDLKGVIQVDDGQGWGDKSKGGNHNSKQIFTPILDAIQSIGKEYPDYYIGLTYGANSHQSENIFTEYGFSKKTPPSKGDIDKPLEPVIIAKIGSLDPVKNILKHIGGTGQAEVLANPDVRTMVSNVYTDSKVKFIIIPFDTMHSKPTDPPGTAEKYGHKDDCLAFAKMFLNSPNTIIVGWRNRKSALHKLDSNMEKQPSDVDMFHLHFALGGGEAGPILDETAKEYIDFLISKWDSESQKFIESKIASGPDLKTKLDGTDTGKKLGEKLDDTKPKLDEKLDDDDTDGADAVVTEKKPTGVTAAEIDALTTKLKGVKLSAGDTGKNSAYEIAEEIFNAFFGGGDKSSQTKEFLMEKVAELAKLDIFRKEGKRKDELAGISKRLETPSTAKKIEEEEDGKKEVKEEEKDDDTDEAEKAAAEKKRKEEEDAAEKKIKEDDDAAKKKGSMGKQLRVMTFNTWYHTFNATKNAGFCNEVGGNECLKNNRNAVLAQMAKTGPVVIFLQEFSYKFDEFIGTDVTISSNKIESKNNVVSGSGTKSTIKAFRHFEINYKGRKFYVYIGQIGESVMATIYSSELVDESATEFFMGNLASGMNPGGDMNQHEIVPTFSGDKNPKLKIDDIKHSGNPYSFRGGSRPFTILRFDTADLKLILLNIHSPHPDVFGELHDGNPPKPDPGAPKAPTTVAEFAFNALGPFFTTHVFTRGIDKTDYTFVAGGDFNADANTAITRLNPILEDANKTIDRTTNKTCCTDKGGTTFRTTVDHIFSTSVISDYKVYDPNATKLEKTKTPSRYYFSDHLPVYATVTLPAAPAKAPAGSGAPAPVGPASESGSNETQISVPTEQQNAEAETSSSGASSATSATSATSEARLKVSGESSEAQVQNDGPSSSAPSAVPSAVPAPEAASVPAPAPTSAPVPAPAPLTTSPTPSGPIRSI